MSDVAERLRLRYPPPRVPRPVLIGLVAIGVVIALGWLIWAALFHSRPAVAGQVSAYTVVSDTEIAVTLTVDRRDPAQSVTCRIVAQATDFSPVGEVEIPVAGGSARLLNRNVTLVTLRRAATATVKGCQVV